MSLKHREPAPPATGMTRTKKPARHLEDELDEALVETFPASDPIAVEPETLVPAPARARKKQK